MTPQAVLVTASLAGAVGWVACLFSHRLPPFGPRRRPSWDLTDRYRR